MESSDNGSSWRVIAGSTPIYIGQGTSFDVSKYYGRLAIVTVAPSGNAFLPCTNSFVIGANLYESWGDSVTHCRTFYDPTNKTLTINECTYGGNNAMENVIMVLYVL